MTFQSQPYQVKPGAVVHRFRGSEAADLAWTEQNRKAVQVVAALSSDREDCIELLAMLGLDAQRAR